MSAVRSVRALVLMSGGLDSQLAVCVLRDQNIAVEGIFFESVFFSSAHAKTAAAALGIALAIEDFTGEILALVAGSPKHGFGGNMNPCIDCHTAMIRRAGAVMRERGFDFTATGEVLNERPMSQNRNALALVAKESGLEGLLLRPLSARLLPETEPEKSGLIRRDMLLAIHGRSRHAQLDLARKYSLHGYASPAGGCLLTDPHFSKRLRDLKRNEGMGELRDVRRLLIGRHFRLPPNGVKLVVGRNHEENLQIQASAAGDELVLTMLDVPGPAAVLPAAATDSHVAAAAAICARYGDSPKSRTTRVLVRSGSGIERTIETMPFTPEETERHMI